MALAYEAGTFIGEALQGLVNQGLLKRSKSFKLDSCEHCEMGKQIGVKFASEVRTTEDMLDCIHADVWGPTKTASLDSNRWFVTFVDDISRRLGVHHAP